MHHDWILFRYEEDLKGFLEEIDRMFEHSLLTGMTWWVIDLQKPVSRGFAVSDTNKLGGIETREMANLVWSLQKDKHLRSEALKFIGTIKTIDLSKEFCVALLSFSKDRVAMEETIIDEKLEKYKGRRLTCKRGLEDLAKYFTSLCCKMFLVIWKRLSLHMENYRNGLAGKSHIRYRVSFEMSLTLFLRSADSF